MDEDLGTKVHLFQGCFLFHFCWSGIPPDMKFLHTNVPPLSVVRRKHLCPSHKKNPAEAGSFHQILTEQHNFFCFLFSYDFHHLSDISVYKHYLVFPVSLTTFYVLHWCIGACDLTARISDMTISLVAVEGRGK